MPFIALFRANLARVGLLDEKIPKKVLRMVSIPALNCSFNSPINKNEMIKHRIRISKRRKYERNSHPSP